MEIWYPIVTFFVQTNVLYRNICQNKIASCHSKNILYVCKKNYQLIVYKKKNDSEFLTNSVLKAKIPDHYNIKFFRRKKIFRKNADQGNLFF